MGRFMVGKALSRCNSAPGEAKGTSGGAGSGRVLGRSRASRGLPGLGLPFPRAGDVRSPGGAERSEHPARAGIPCLRSAGSADGFTGSPVLGITQEDPRHRPAPVPSVARASNQTTQPIYSPKHRVIKKKTTNGSDSHFGGRTCWNSRIQQMCVSPTWQGREARRCFPPRAAYHERSPHTHFRFPWQNGNSRSINPRIRVAGIPGPAGANLSPKALRRGRTPAGRGFLRR